MIRKDYYENENNRGEYLYLTSKDDITINALYCEGYTSSSINGTLSNRNGTTERVETIALRDESPKLLIILLVLLITFIIMVCIYSKINNMDNDVEYVIKYNKTNNTSVNTNAEIPNK